MSLLFAIMATQFAPLLSWDGRVHINYLNGPLRLFPKTLDVLDCMHIAKTCISSRGVAN